MSRRSIIQKPPNEFLNAIAVFLSATFVFKADAEPIHKAGMEHIWKQYVDDKNLPLHFKARTNWTSNVCIMLLEYQKSIQRPHFEHMRNFVPQEYRNEFIKLYIKPYFRNLSFDSIRRQGEYQSFMKQADELLASQNLPPASVPKKGPSQSQNSKISTPISYRIYPPNLVIPETEEDKSTEDGSAAQSSRFVCRSDNGHIGYRSDRRKTKKARSDTEQEVVISSGSSPEKQISSTENLTDKNQSSILEFDESGSNFDIPCSVSKKKLAIKLLENVPEDMTADRDFRN
jgi:hypothetical protein